MAKKPTPDFTSPIAGRIEVRVPCAWCGDRQMIPRHQFDEHVMRLHPDVKTGERRAAASSAPAAPAERRDRYEAEASPWYEVINPRNATTSIALVHDDGDLYLPEGPDALTVEEFHFAAARGQAHRLMRVEEAVAVADTEQAELRSYVAELEQQAAARPLSRAYSHEACGFHWYGRDGMDIPLRDGQPICPRCELAQGQTAVLPADATAEVRKLVKRLVAHAKGFQDVLDDGDSEAWGKTVGADIEALQAALDGHPLRRLADEAPQPEPRPVAPAAGLQRLAADRQPDCPPGTHAPGAPCTGEQQQAATGYGEVDCRTPETHNWGCGCPTDPPHRGDWTERWLRERREEYPRGTAEWHTVDAVLDRYRLHADTGTLLSDHVCECRDGADCDCRERQAGEGR